MVRRTAYTRIKDPDPSRESFKHTYDDYVQRMQDDLK